MLASGLHGRLLLLGIGCGVSNSPTCHTIVITELEVSISSRQVALKLCLPVCCPGLVFVLFMSWPNFDGDMYT